MSDSPSMNENQLSRQNPSRKLFLCPKLLLFEYFTCKLKEHDLEKFVKLVISDKHSLHFIRPFIFGIWLEPEESYLLLKFPNFENPEFGVEFTTKLKIQYNTIFSLWRLLKPKDPTLYLNFDRNAHSELEMGRRFYRLNNLANIFGDKFGLETARNGSHIFQKLFLANNYKRIDRLICPVVFVQPKNNIISKLMCRKFRDEFTNIPLELKHYKHSTTLMHCLDGFNLHLHKIKELSVGGGVVDTLSDERLRNIDYFVFDYPETLSLILNFSKIQTSQKFSTYFPNILRHFPNLNKFTMTFNLNNVFVALTNPQIVEQLQTLYNNISISKQTLGQFKFSWFVQLHAWIDFDSQEELNVLIDELKNHEIFRHFKFQPLPFVKVQGIRMLHANRNLHFDFKLKSKQAIGMEEEEDSEDEEEGEDFYKGEKSIEDKEDYGKKKKGKEEKDEDFYKGERYLDDEEEDFEGEENEYSEKDFEQEKPSTSSKKRKNPQDEYDSKKKRR